MSPVDQNDQVERAKHSVTPNEPDTDDDQYDDDYNHDQSQDQGQQGESLNDCWDQAHDIVKKYKNRGKSEGKKTEGAEEPKAAEGAEGDEAFVGEKNLQGGRQAAGEAGKNTAKEVGNTAKTAGKGAAKSAGTGTSGAGAAGAEGAGTAATAGAEGATVAGEAAAGGGLAATETGIAGAGVAAAPETAGISLIVVAVVTVALFVGYKLKKFLPKIILTILAVLMVPFLLLGFLGASTVPKMSATTAADQNTINADLSLGNDPGATSEDLTKRGDKVIDSLTKLKDIAKKTYPSDPTKVTQCQKDIDAIIPLIKNLPNIQDIDSRKVSFAEIEKKLADFKTKYPELTVATADCAALRPYITSGQLIFNRPIESDMIPYGKSKRGELLPANNPKAIKYPSLLLRDINIKPNVCKTIDALMKAGYSITIWTVVNGHSPWSKKSDNRLSAHYTGGAFDIATINGASCSKPCSNPSQNWLDQTKKVQDFIIANRIALGTDQMFGIHADPNEWLDNGNGINPNDSSWSGQIASHKNHIHIGVK